MALKDSLISWGRIIRSHGEIEKADLLDTAASAVIDGRTDARLSLELATWATMSDAAGNPPSFGRDLRQASEALLPS